MAINYDTMLGERHGRLTVTKVLGRIVNPSGKSGVKVTCRCDCGVVKDVWVGHIRTGATTSCGCLQREKAAAMQHTHGLSDTKVYRTWCKIHSRCNATEGYKYERYGARGIKVCERWSTFEPFYVDMGEPPSAEHTIERIDNDGNYEPGNCRWATTKEQASNRSRNVWIPMFGRNYTITQISELASCSTTFVKAALKRGYSAEDIVSGTACPRKPISPETAEGIISEWGKRSIKAVAELFEVSTTTVSKLWKLYEAQNGLTHFNSTTSSK